MAYYKGDKVVVNRDIDISMIGGGKKTYAAGSKAKVISSEGLIGAGAHEIMVCYEGTTDATTVRIQDVMPAPEEQVDAIKAPEE